MLRIPDSIPLDAAAPLLCAGITAVFAAAALECRARQAVAIIGLGGLGHMGVKLAQAMGAEVTVLSQSLKKMEDGLRLGADEYYATSDPDTFTKLAGSFDLILNTVSANLDMGDYLGLLDHRRHAGRTRHARASDGGAGLPAGRGPPQPGRFDDRRHPETQEMLDFCAEHDVRPEIEVIAAGLHQRGLRARARQRRAVPLRHRHRVAAERSR